MSAYKKAAYLIKICGNKYPADSQKVARYEPDFMGWIFSPKSLRRVSLPEIKSQVHDIKERYPKIRHVAVFAENSIDEIMTVARQRFFDCIQVAEESAFLIALKKVLLAGESRAENSSLVQILPAIRVQRSLSDDDLAAYGNVPLFILDSFVAGQPGGTGKRLQPELIASLKRAYLLAGGLDPYNVAEALDRCRACGVDVSSGIEDEIPGRKNESKIAALVNAVRSLKPHFQRETDPWKMS